MTISSAAGGTGHVTSVPIGIDCPGDCIAEFVVGTTVTLTATPLGGSNFLGWSGACTGTGACVVTMDAAKTVNASFLGVIGGGMLEVNIVDPARNPVVPSHAAIKRNGVWESLPVQSSYMLDVDHRFELAFRCGVGVRMYHGTIDEITMLRVECPTTLPSTTFSYSWNFDDIGFGTASTILNGPTGAFDFGSGSSNTKVVTGFPQFPRFDLLFVGRRTNLPVVYDIRRGLELPFTEPLNFNPPPFNAPEPQSLPPFMVPEGILSGFWEMQFATRRAFMSVGTGSSGGGVFRAVPSSLLQNGDKYVLLAGGTGMGGHSVSFAGVAAMQAAVGVQLPRRWSDFVAPQPSLTPVFLNLGFDEEDELPGVGFRFDISYPSGPKVNNFWHTFVTRAYLGSAQSYTFETPNLPGFIDIAIVSSDLVRFVTHRFSANRLMGVLLGVRLIGGTPAVDGLLLKTASVTGTFTAP